MNPSEPRTTSLLRARQVFGYFVMPILHGDRLIGRIDPLYDRTANVLRINAVHAEPDAPTDAWPKVRREIDALATWLGADGVEVVSVPAVWR